MKVKAFAKINLTLKVFPKKEKRKLHKIKSIITLVDDLYDTIEIKKSPDHLWHIETNIPELNNEENYVSIIANFIRKDFDLNDDPIKLVLTKNIPIKSGLGGGSSDAMATIKLLDEFFKLNISKSQKLKYAKMIGSDCFFFLENFKTALVTKYGNKIKRLKNISFVKRDLFFSNIKCDTKLVYESFDKNYNKQWRKFNNNLIIPCFKIYPELEKEFNDLKTINKQISMTGSGSTFIKWPMLK
ncbi:hypothetical protein [Spiroplasma endosymbiont of Labia minor]|uniref:4-(cytidine 5'-diphospho)-2-C-methyl-D-erythritol kinase n=1 Tax=Spiroplasma endosymbiont of Labia minor TaxID=3066305 RepID=UPI0030CB4977